jgi:hypothetical protein
MKCPECKEPVGVSGRYKVTEAIDESVREGEPALYYFKEFRPEFFTESPQIFRLPSVAPAGVLEDLTASFRLFWGDTEACGNRIRSAVENLLNDQGVRRTNQGKGGKRIRLSLHSRIVEFRNRQRELGNALMAVKWIGNAGSHTQSLTRDDLLDGYNLLDHVLEELYVNRRKQIAKLSREINRRKRPRSSKRTAKGALHP